MKMQNMEKYDDFFLHIAEEEKQRGIEGLLSVFFSFLHRKTDFYVVSKTKSQQQQLGFPPNHALNLLCNTFKKYPMKDAEKVLEELHQQNESPATVHETITTSNTQQQQMNSMQPAKNANNVEKSVLKTSTQGSLLDTIKYTEDGKQVPIGNGGVTPEYSWVQSLEEVTVYADVPEGTSAKDIRCDISSTGLKFGLKGHELLLNGEFPYKVRCTDSLWSLDSNKTVVISLEKIQHTWWKSGDAEIDATKVDSTMKVQDYDEKTQGAIRKIMFDQKQKALGLPDSTELSNQAILEKAKSLPGSPFLK